MLGFWMGKDSKDHPLGERGSTGGPGFAESGGRNWVHSAATVLAFLQKERGLLQPGYKFRPIVPGEPMPEILPREVSAKWSPAAAKPAVDSPTPAIVEPAAAEPAATELSCGIWPWLSPSFLIEPRRLHGTQYQNRFR